MGCRQHELRQQEQHSQAAQTGSNWPAFMHTRLGSTEGRTIAKLGDERTCYFITKSPQLQPVADARLGDDVLGRLGPCLDLGTQLAHIDAQILHIAARAPDLVH